MDIYKTVEKQWDDAISAIEELLRQLRTHRSEESVRHVIDRVVALEELYAREQTAENIAVNERMFAQFCEAIADIPVFKNILSSPKPAFDERSHSVIEKMIGEAEEIRSLNIRKKEAVNNIANGVDDDHDLISELALISNEMKARTEKVAEYLEQLSGPGADGRDISVAARSAVPPAADAVLQGSLKIEILEDPKPDEPEAANVSGAGNLIPATVINGDVSFDTAAADVGISLEKAIESDTGSDASGSVRSETASATAGGPTVAEEATEFDWLSEAEPSAQTRVERPENCGEPDWYFVHSLIECGNYRRAYWYLRTYPQLAKRSAAYAQLLLALGASLDLRGLQPGGSCGALFHRNLLEMIEIGERSSSASRLLFAVTVEAALFADPVPDSLYFALPAIELPAGPLMNLADFLRRNVERGARLPDKVIDAARQSMIMEDRLRDLVRQATDHYDRVGSVTMSYKPAAIGLRHLYALGSDLWRLHDIIRRHDAGRREEVKDLVTRLDVERMIDGLVDDPSVQDVHCKIVGSGRERMIRYINTSLGLAREWENLVQRPKRDNNPSVIDFGKLHEHLGAALDESHTVEAGNLDGAIDAFCVASLKRTRAKLAGESISEPAGDTLLLLRGFALDDDLEPTLDETDAAHQALRQAMLAISDETYPQAIFDECISRDEFFRAYQLVQAYEDADWLEVLSDRQGKRVDGIRAEIDRCSAEAENAYLLGELGVEGSDRSAMSRLLQQAQQLIERIDLNNLRPVRAAADVLKRVQDEVSALREKRREIWQSKLEELIGSVPNTPEAQEDAQYLKKNFKACLDLHDDVAALELLEQGKDLLPKGDRLPRLNVEDTSALLSFFNTDFENLFSDTSAASLIASVRSGAKLPVGDFSRLDSQEREQAAKVIDIWARLRSGQTRNETPVSLVCDVLGAIGFLITPGNAQQHRSPDSDFLFLRVPLAGAVYCPVPSFGSSLGRDLDVVVCLAKKDARQIGDYLRRQKLSERSTIVLYTHPVSNVFRLSFRRYCAGAKVSALLVDYGLFFHLLQFRDRLRVLFDLALPFTYSQPYLMKGDNVPREVFVGRDEQFKTLCDPKGGSVVYGGRQLGKSALLRRIVREENNPKAGVYVAYVDIDDLGHEPTSHLEMENEFVRRIAKELLRIGFLDKQLPQMQPKKGAFGALESAILEAVGQRRGFHKLLVLLDEADDFLDKEDVADFSIIRRIRSFVGREDAKGVKFIFAGLQSVLRYANRRNQPFAQLGVLDPIQPLGRADGEKLIVAPLRALGFRFEDRSLILRILSQTNYHPGLIQIFCHRLLDRLYDRWGGEVGLVNEEQPIRLISRQDVTSVEQDRSFLQDIRNRFDWTLDLDERYKVLIYVLVMQGKATDTYTRNEFQEIATSWWPQAFDGMQAAQFDQLLHELVGLGILAATQNEGADVPRFGLRSPNILRLLGTARSIEAEFTRLINRSGRTIPQPRDYRASREGNQIGFSPFTREQEAKLFNQQNPFALIFVTGSAATGLEAVDERVGDLFANEQKDSRDAWSEIKIPPELLARGAPAVDYIHNALRLKNRQHHFAVIEGSFVFDGVCNGMDLISDMLSRLSLDCRKESLGRVIMKLDPKSYWKALINGYPHLLKTNGYVAELQLRPWTDGAVRQAMEAIGSTKDVACLRTNTRETAEEIQRVTGGYHQLVVRGFEILQGNLSKVRSSGDALRYWVQAVKICHADAAANREEMRHRFGLSVEEYPQLAQLLEAIILEYSQKVGSDQVMKAEDFGELYNFLPESAQGLARHGGRLIRTWMEGVGLARTGPKHEILLSGVLHAIAR